MLKKWAKRIGYTVLAVFIFINIIAAFQAYKFTHFYADAPKPKKPSEMSASEKASAIFFGVQYPKSKVVDSFLVAHDTVHITTQDSVHLESWYAAADTTNGKIPRGTVLMFHGHGSSKSGIIAEATAFHEMGYHIIVTDFRAHGNSEGSTTSIGMYEARDVKAVYDYVLATKEKNIVLYGISMGAATITKAVSEYGLKPSKVILEMPFATLQDAVAGRMRTMQLPAEPLSTLLTFWGGVELGAWAFNYQPQKDAAAINCPVLLQWGVNDPRVTESETHQIFKNLASHQKELIKYVQSGHQSLCKNEKSKWYMTVGRFLMM
jgi:uncharacterized protein